MKPMGTQPSLRSVNLNLIPILQALLRERGVSKAARALGLSQPTVSIALAKLRGVLRDPLLVQVEGSWELTRSALALVEPVENVCRALEAICYPAPYDPRTATGSITVALPDAAAMVIATPLVEALRQYAPNLQLRFIDIWREFRVGQRSDEIQFLVSLGSILARPEYGELRSAPLWTDRMVTVIGADHEPAEGGVDARYSVFFPGLEPIAPEANEFFESYTKGVNVTGRYQYFGVLAILAAEANARVKMPLSLANKLKRYLPLQILDRDIGDAEMSVRLAWSPVLDADPAHRWIRNLMIQTIKNEALLSG